ncbi:MAG: hypothetical protein PHY34_01180 [Patescibacteria group bacterium]|nr:hypothetical protein [Patescibacteria group bacterium]MDD5715169.1 hypothetical protein [Patescibacteria group bacterium]
MGIFLRFKWVIIATTAVAIGAAVISSLVKPVEYDTSLSFSINRINRQDTTEYQYDGYYAIQAADLFSQTVMSWMMTPSVLLEIYERATIDPRISSTEQFTSRFKVKQYSPQNIAVRFRERDRATAETIAAAITQTVEERATAAVQTADQKAFFQVIGAKPVIVEKRPALWFNAAIGLFAGLIVGVTASYSIAYLKTGRVSTANDSAHANRD